MDCSDPGQTPCEGAWMAVYCNAVCNPCSGKIPCNSCIGATFFNNNYVLFITILYLFDLTGPALIESISKNADLTFMQIAKSTGNAHWVDNMTHHN